MIEKPYETPAIIYEGELEVQAGSPLGSGADELFDPLGLGLDND